MGLVKGVHRVYELLLIGRVEFGVEVGIERRREM